MRARVRACVPACVRAHSCVCEGEGLRDVRPASIAAAVAAHRVVVST